MATAEQQALQPVPDEETAVVQAPPIVTIFERFAKDKDIDVDKLERLMGMWERNEARQSEIAYNAAMSRAQAEIRPVLAAEHNSQTNSKYASYEALDLAIRPVYIQHGFGLSFDTGESPLDQHVRVLCYVSHRDGHAKTYHVDIPADGKGAKGGDVMTKTHAVGSALSYGMRYLLKLIFNVAITERDDDGNSAGKKEEKPAPSGYDAWFSTLEGVADEGMKAFTEAWNKSPKEFRGYLSRTAPRVQQALKERAARVGKATA